MTEEVLRLDRNSVVVSEAAKQYMAKAKAANTIRAYQADIRDFREYCRQHACQALPAAPETVVNYLTFLAADRKVATLQRRLCAISQAHQAAGFDTPTRAYAVRVVMQGIRRTKGTMPDKKQAAVIEDIRAMVEPLTPALPDIRDRALVLLGFAGALRRSELVALRVTDLQFGRQGLTITLQRSKTDQSGQGYKKGIPYGSNPDTCPVWAIQAWLTAAAIAEGPVFRRINRHGQLGRKALSDRSVALIVKKLARGAGLPAQYYAGHSLRSGLITTAALHGTDERSIMKQSGHRSVAVMRGYIQEATVFKNNAATQVGL